ncbi:hypothetical protein P8452_48298 [Trifolium repens]|nr:hypothetical protein P8452_48298 [Trifolium repens]
MHDRFHDLIDPPVFDPPVKLVIDKYNLPPYFVDDLPDSPELLAYDHDPAYFQYKYDTLSTHSDVSAGFLMLPYRDFGEHVFHETTPSVKLVDDSGNAWTCTLEFVSAPVQCFKVGGQWSVLVAIRKLTVGDHI